MGVIRPAQTRAAPLRERLSSVPASRGRVGQDLVGQIRDQFVQLDQDVPNIIDTAVRLGMSARTLRRRLSALGTSYREILRDVRADRARARLKEPLVTVDEIAQELGYTEAANFRHAFWRWMGCSPRDFRRQACGTAPGINEAA